MTEIRCPPSGCPYRDDAGVCTSSRVTLSPSGICSDFWEQAKIEMAARNRRLLEQFPAQGRLSSVSAGGTESDERS